MFNINLVYETSTKFSNLNYVFYLRYTGTGLATGPWENKKREEDLRCR